MVCVGKIVAGVAREVGEERGGWEVGWQGVGEVVDPRDIPGGGSEGGVCGGKIVAGGGIGGWGGGGGGGKGEWGRGAAVRTGNGGRRPWQMDGCSCGMLKQKVIGCWG